MKDNEQRGALGDKLGDYPSSSPIPAGLDWEAMGPRIQAELATRRKRRRLLWWWWLPFGGFLIGLVAYLVWSYGTAPQPSRPDLASAAVSTGPNGYPAADSCLLPATALAATPTAAPLPPPTGNVAPAPSSSPSTPANTVAASAARASTGSTQFADGALPDPSLTLPPANQVQTTPPDHPITPTPHRLHPTPDPVAALTAPQAAALAPRPQPGLAGPAFPPLCLDLPTAAASTLLVDSLATRQPLAARWQWEIGWGAQLHRSLQPAGTAAFPTRTIQPLPGATGELLVGRRLGQGPYAWRTGLSWASLVQRETLQTEFLVNLYQPNRVDTIYRNTLTGQERVVYSDSVRAIRRVDLRQHNRLQVYALPVLVQRQWALGSWPLALQTGLELNWSGWRAGQAIGPGASLVATSRDGVWGMAFRLEGQLYSPPTRFGRFFARVAYRQALGARSGSLPGTQFQPRVVGLLLGVAVGGNNH